jgi:hypothetical protein
MADDARPLRRRKPVLVASIGVATVSYLALQTGCEEEEQMHQVANLLAPPLDASFDPSVVPDAAEDGGFDAWVSGNLLPPPPTEDDAGPDALVPSGNLLPPPADAALDAAQDAAQDAAHDAAHDAKVDTGIPTSGNLLPPLPPERLR